MKGRVEAHIDLSALRDNFVLASHQAAQVNSDAQLLAVVKANAYGNGLEQVCLTLADRADAFGVTDVSEALKLDGLNLKNPVLILQGMIDREDLKHIAEHDFQLVVSSLPQLARINDYYSRTPPRKPLTFWLKMDTGMGRLGLSPDDYAIAYRELRERPYTSRVIMMTHLANSSLPGDKLNTIQLTSFNRLYEILKHPESSICASAGLMRDTPFYSDWARPGIMLYGSSPFHWQEEHLRAEKLGIRAVSTLKSRLIAVKNKKRGDNIGYCSQYICPEDMRIGVVSIGYADGYPSNAPNGTPVLVNGQRTSTVGRVSMDMLAIDLSNISGATVDDEVILWGNDLSIDEVAAKTGILSYNLMSSLSSRVHFLYHP